LSPPPYRICAASWNRSIAALDKLYRWAADEKLIAKSPFTYRQAWARATGGPAMTIAANCAAERGVRTSDVRFLSLDRYLLFREVGLRGRLPEGAKTQPGKVGTVSAMRCSPNCL